MSDRDAVEEMLVEQAALDCYRLAMNDLLHGNATRVIKSGGKIISVKVLVRDPPSDEEIDRYRWETP